MYAEIFMRGPIGARFVRGGCSKYFRKLSWISSVSRARRDEAKWERVIMFISLFSLETLLRAAAPRREKTRNNQWNLKGERCRPK
jgi:hypothetical protein